MRRSVVLPHDEVALSELETGVIQRHDRLERRRAELLDLKDLAHILDRPECHRCARTPTPGPRPVFRKLPPDRVPKQLSCVSGEISYDMEDVKCRCLEWLGRETLAINVGVPKMTEAKPAWRERVENSKKEGLGAVELFVVLTEPTGDRQRVKEHLKVHLDYQRELERRGHLALAGPISDEKGEEWTGRGLIILRADTLQEARAIAEADPMHRDGVRRFTLVPWLLNEASLTISFKMAAGIVKLS